MFCSLFKLGHCLLTADVLAFPACSGDSPLPETRAAEIFSVCGFIFTASSSGQFLRTPWLGCAERNF